MNLINKTSLNFVLGFIAILVISFVLMISINIFEEAENTQATACAEEGAC